jgi:NAD(P)H-nitrite reductase large subunit
MRITVIGAGHAGVEAARAARQAGAEVTLLSAESVLPYYRPRLVAYAFGQAEFEAIRMHPADWYSGQGIDLRLDAPVEAIGLRERTVTAAGRTEPFDALVIAAGANPNVPAFAGANAEAVLPLWNVRHAAMIRGRVKPGGRLVIIGGGILGIEAALRALDAGMTVHIIELMARLMPAQLGHKASSVLLHRLKEKGLSVVLGHAVKSAEALPGAGVRLELDDHRTLEADLCFVSIGSKPDCSLPSAAGVAVERGVVVDAQLRTSDSLCFAAGDMIQFHGLTRCSALEATNQGRIAGANAAAAIQGGALRTYQPETLPLMFRSGDFELYAIGQPGGVGYEEHLLDGTTESVIRSLVTRDGIPFGVQMIGTRHEFDRCATLVKKTQKGEPAPDLTDLIGKNVKAK